MPQTCALIVSDSLREDSLILLNSHLRLLIKLKFQVELSRTLVSLPENLKNQVRVAEVTKKKTSILSKLLKPIVGGDDEKPSISQAHFSISYDLEDSDLWSAKHILVLTNFVVSDEKASANLKKTQKIIVPSHAIKKHLVDTHHVPTQNVEVIYPFYSRELFSNKDRVHQRNMARQKLGLESKNFIIGLFDHDGTTDEEKKFVEDLSIKLNENSNIKLVYTSKVDVSRAVFFHALDLFALPTANHQFGVAGLEAMGCGLPVLAHAQAGVSELILSKQFVKENLEVDTWSLYIQELESQRDWLQSVGRQNAERALLFDENQHLKRLIQVFAQEQIVNAD